MNWIDIIILILLALAVGIGFKKGLVQEIVGIIALVIAFFLALKMHLIAAAMLTRMISGLPKHIAPMVGFVAVFLIVFLAITIVGWILSKIIKATPLDLADKIGGMVIGLVKGALIISVILLLLALAPLPREFNSKLDRSGMIRSIRKVAPLVYEKSKGLWPKAQKLYQEFEKAPTPKKVEQII
ncbi:MAG: CvpA family protein [Candidatus Edwardsbacteria bacterium]|nr:CvpA family protein [Candidatus Edwardsbacteria bacterium]